MKKIICGIVLSAAIGSVSHPLGACGPFFQPSYLEDEKPYSIELNHDAAMLRLAAGLSDLLKEKDIFSSGVSSAQASRDDFAAAVEKHLAVWSAKDKKDLITAYNNYVNKRRKHCLTASDKFPLLPEPLQEFALYYKGVEEMVPNGKSVPPSWQKLLALPPAKRFYRTVWVHFMLGNYLPHECHKHYRNCRDAVRAGFSDNAGLAKASFANEFYWGADQVLAIHAGIARQRHEKDKAFIKQLYFKLITPAMLEDELCRELMAAFNVQDPLFLQNMKKYKFRNTDIMAYYAWKKGDWRAAKEYIALLNEPTLLSLYIESQLARMSGKQELALKKLRNWLKMAEKITPYERKDLTVRKDYLSNREAMELEIYGCLGNAMVLRRDFIDAAEFFYRAGQLEHDFVKVAEHYMSLEDLVKFTERISRDSKRSPGIIMQIRHLTARRAFREKRMDLAGKYMPQSYLEHLNNYQKFLRQSADKTLDRNHRALALYNAFKIMRLYGMELCGTESEPDNSRYHGSFNNLAWFSSCKACYYNKNDHYWTLCGRHRKVLKAYRLPGLGARFDWSKVPVHLRFHYRYRAAELALLAGDTASDPELKALINFAAGFMLSSRSPQEADIFYKRLVTQGRGTYLAALADKQRWFPAVNGLTKEINSAEPLKSIKDIHCLMQQIFKPVNAAK